MGAKQRILEYLKIKGIEKRKFAKVMGFSHTILNSGENLGSEKLEKIISIYKDINLHWIVTGQGNMIFDHQQEPPNFENSKKILASIEKVIDRKIENLAEDIEKKLYIKYLEDMKDYLTLDEKIEVFIEELKKLQQVVNEKKIDNTTS